MGRAMGAGNRKKHDTHQFLLQFIKRARRSRPCCKCDRIIPQAILGPDVRRPLTGLVRVSGMTLATLKDHIRESGWWCRSCQSKSEQIGSSIKKQPKVKSAKEAWGKTPGYDCPPEGWRG